MGEARCFPVGEVPACLFCRWDKCLMGGEQSILRSAGHIQPGLLFVIAVDLQQMKQVKAGVNGVFSKSPFLFSDGFFRPRDGIERHAPHRKSCQRPQTAPGD